VSGGASLRRVRFLTAAADDMRALARRSRPVLIEVFGLLVLLDWGSISATPLQDFAKTGDVRDCGKLIVAVEGEPEHRIVVREVGGRFEVVAVVAVVAVEDRTDDLPYFLSGLRLGRLDDPVRRSEAQRRVVRIRRLLDRD
jgi:hypothetical protein